MVGLNFFSLKSFSKRKYLFFKKYKNNCITISKNDIPIPIDIIIPVVKKDIDVLPFVVKFARQNIKHIIKKIIIVAPESDEIIKICNDLNLVYVNENSVISIHKSEIVYLYNGVDRSGWLFQQFIKLFADNISNSKYILVLDADTIFINPIQFVYSNKKRLDFSDEFHLPYFKTFENLTKLKHKYPVSFISHYMLFESEKLKQLRQWVERKNSASFLDAILNLINQQEQSFFSEYETYANFVLKRFKKEYIVEYWYNISLSKKKFENIDNALNSVTNKSIKSVSFHAYIE